VTPDGRTILAPLPAGIDGHFGPELRRFVLMHYHQGQSTLPRLTALLQWLGVSISKRQVQRLLTDKPDAFVVIAHPPPGSIEIMFIKGLSIQAGSEPILSILERSAWGGIRGRVLK